MASDKEQGNKARLPAPRRRLRLLAAILALVLLVPAALVAWLLASESGARAAFALASSATQDALRTEGVRGRLLGPLRIERLSFDSAGQTITLDHLQLEWRPRALFDELIDIQSLHIGRLDILLKDEDTQKEPPQLPDNIALPLKLRMTQSSIDAGTVRSATTPLVTFGGMALALEFDGAHYRLILDRLALRGGGASASGGLDVRGAATLSTAKPYAIQAELASGGSATIGADTVKAQGKITLAGSLEQLAVGADLSAQQARLDGSLVLHPFAAQKLGPGELKVQGVDLAAFRQDLPRTALSGKLSVADDGSGELILNNAAAASFGPRVGAKAGQTEEHAGDASRLPVSALQLAFRQEEQGMAFTRIQTVLGSSARPAGSVRGSGRLHQGELTLELRLSQVNLRGLDARLQPTQLSGDVAIRHVDGRQEFTVDVREPIGKKNRDVALSAHALLADGRLALERAELRAGAGRIEASGHAELEGNQTFELDARMRAFRLRDIGEFSQWPELLLNGRVQASGQRQPQLRANLELDIRDSRIAGQVLQAEGRARLDGETLDVTRLAVAAGANRVSVNGRLSQDEGQLAFSVDAPRLDQIGPAFGGALKAEGKARGSFRQPRIDANWAANEVRLPGEWRIAESRGKAELQIDRRGGQTMPLASLVLDGSAHGVRAGERGLTSLTAQVRFGRQAGAPLQVAVQARGAGLGGPAWDSIEVNADGSTGRHTLQLKAVQAAQSWSLQAEGGLSGLERAPQWQGSVLRVDGDGTLRVRLEAPAPLQASAQKVQLERLRLDTSAGRIAVEQFLRDAKGIVTRGSIGNLQVERLLQLRSPELPFGSDLQLSGEWNLALTDNASGSFVLRRDKGDVVMRGNVPVALGLSRLEAEARAADGQITLRLHAQGRQLGRIEGEGRVALAKGLALNPDAPLSAAVELDLPSLAWAGALISPTLVAEGRVQSTVRVAGTLSNPSLAGRIAGSNLRLLLADIGIDLRQGSLDSEFRDSELLLNSLRFGSAGAQVNVSGKVDLAAGQPTAQAVLRAERFPLFDRSDRRIIVSGESRIGWSRGIADIKGEFKTDSGFIDISSLDMPRLSDDVVVVGRDTGQEGGAKSKERKGLPAAIDVALALGEGVTLRGRGLDALLRGELRLASQPGEELRARGALRVEKGSFTAYGRELAIETGVLRFNGPLNNPALDILAMRRGQEVAAGVAVRGTVLAPRITLVSEPSVSDAEKLSWLVLGRGLSAAGQGDVGALQAAAGALLSQGAAAGVQSQIASAFGLDQLSIGSSEQGTVQDRIVTLGKQISSRLYMSFRRGLETASSVLHLRYTLTSRITLEAETGTSSALSVFYNFAFD